LNNAERGLVEAGPPKGGLNQKSDLVRLEHGNATNSGLSRPDNVQTLNEAVTDLRPVAHDAADAEVRGLRGTTRNATTVQRREAGNVSGGSVQVRQRRTHRVTVNVGRRVRQNKVSTEARVEQPRGRVRTLASGSLVRLEQRPDHVSVVVGDGRRVARTHNRNVGANLSGAQRRAATGEIRSRLLGSVSSKTNLNAAIVNRDNLTAQGERLRGDNLAHERLLESVSQQGTRVLRLNVHREGVKSN